MKTHRITAFAIGFGVALFVTSLSTRIAHGAEPLAGTWKLVSAVMEDLDTKEKTVPFGQHPAGFAIFTPEKRFMIIWTAEGRNAGQSDAERVRNFMTSYSTAGTYRVEGSKYYLTVEVSQFPAMVGTEQTRDFKIEGSRLTVLTAPEKSPRNDHMMQSTVVWARDAK